ncbi:MAG: cardiolipin synthase B [Gluconacetobacter diazotrophicus]|nr:cardiolipin synthase B [Gluconacetobacter diazotrophicus]
MRDTERRFRRRLLRHHGRQHRRLGRRPLLDGNAVELLPDGRAVVLAVMDAVAAAQDFVHMEYYTFDDVSLDGRSLFGLLREAAGRGVEVAVSWDAVGSGGTPDAALAELERAGVRVSEYHSVNPLRRRFNLNLNDRDHRKLTVVDGAVAILGGVNMSRVYETPEAVGRGSDADHAYWIDNGVRLRGPAVAEAERLFRHGWRQQRNEGPALRGATTGSAAAAGSARVRIEGSAPHERKPLFNRTMRRAIRTARSHVILATGYFVPARREWRLLARAARRGVRVELLVPGYSDVQGAVHAARALYGPLLLAGVRVAEVRQAMLHAKIATFDGVLTVVGSSNFDRRSVLYNNEIDAVVLDTGLARQVETLLERHMAAAASVTYEEWRRRPLREHLLEVAARLWKHLM